MLKSLLLAALLSVGMAAHAQADPDRNMCIDIREISGMRVVGKSTVAFMLRDGTVLLNQIDGEVPSLIYQGGSVGVKYPDNLPKLCENVTRLFIGRLEYRMGPFTLDPNSRFVSAQALFASGNAHMEHNELDDAIGDFSAAITLAPKLAEIRAVRALAYFSKGNLPHAKQDIADAIALDPKNPAIVGVKSYLDQK